MLEFFRSLRIGTKVLAVVILTVVGIVVANVVRFVGDFQHSTMIGLEREAAQFTAVADAAKEHAAELAANGSFNHDELLREVEEFRKSGRPYNETRIFKTLPIVVGWQSAERAAEKENVKFKVVAFNARNKENLPEPGSIEESMLRELEKQVDAGGTESLSRVDENINSLRYMHAVRLTQDCLICHGDPTKESDPDGDGRDLLGFPMERWKVGHMHGAFEVIKPLAESDAAVASTVRGSALFSGVLTLVASGLLLLMFRGTVSRPVSKIVETMSEIARDNDLTKRVRISSKDELGQIADGVNGLLDNMHEIVSKVSEGAQEVAAAATEIASSSEQIAGGMAEQSKQIDQVSSASSEMAASVVEVAQKAQGAATDAEHSGEAARSGGEIVAQTITGMQAINEAVSAGASSVSELGKRSEQIGRIVEVINDIADQTNLLALNAAIEAARAGEHGRGFAVVADEVRKLADRTTKATEEIAQSISAIQTETREAVDRIMSGTKQVGEGMAHAEQAGESLKQIIDSAGSLSDRVRSIAAAAEEQSAAGEQISRSIESVAAVSRQTTDAASQAASASTQLSSRAEQLRALVTRFKTSRQK